MGMSFGADSGTGGFGFGGTVGIRGGAGGDGAHSQKGVCGKGWLGLNILFGGAKVPPSACENKRRCGVCYVHLLVDIALSQAPVRHKKTLNRTHLDKHQTSADLLARPPL